VKILELHKTVGAEHRHRPVLGAYDFTVTWCDTGATQILPSPRWVQRLQVQVKGMMTKKAIRILGKK